MTLRLPSARRPDLQINAIDPSAAFRKALRMWLLVVQMPES
ncbi:hypothetical protein [Arthrobacter sp. A5]